MWTRINEQVDALVEFKRSLPRPLLKAITWQGKRRTMVGLPMIEADEHSLYYDARDRSTRYALRFDLERQAWTLEGIDDSGIMHAGRDLPPPRVFAPTNWSS